MRRSPDWRASIRVALGLTWVPLALAIASCSPGTLPGSPTPFTPGGGARYSGTMTIARVAGSQSFGTGQRPLDLSLVLGPMNQLTGQFAAGDAVGSLTAELSGSLTTGTFVGQILISLPVTQAGAAVTCDGIQDVEGTFSGGSVTFAASFPLGYRVCPGLLTTVSAAATAISPVPGAIGNRANVIVTVSPGTTIAEGTCESGVGYGFTITLVETAGVAVTFDADYRLIQFDEPIVDVSMPVTGIGGGGRRSFTVCRASAGLFQAVFRGRDDNGNTVLAASPVLTVGDLGQLANWGTYATAAAGDGPQLQICVRDYSAEDGDILRLSVNGVVVIERELFFAEFCQPITFREGQNTITATALNDGTNPPNSGEVTVSAINAAGERISSTTRIQKYGLPAGTSSSSSIIVNIAR